MPDRIQYTADQVHLNIGTIFSDDRQEEEDRAVAQLHSLTGRGGEGAFQARLQSGVQTVLTVRCVITATLHTSICAFLRSQVTKIFENREGRKACL